MKTQGQRVKHLREHLNKRQDQFAALCDISTNSLSKIENDATVPTKKTLQKIIDKTGVDKDWLLFNKGYMEIAKPAIGEMDSESPWKDEAYSNLKAEKEYFKRNYEKLLEILLSGKKPENLNFPKSLDEKVAVIIPLYTNRTALRDQA